jgi:dihydrodipicolinate synthase/N-acetylneuraminate lyase
MKDSSGDMESIQRIATGTDALDFDLLVGAGSIAAPALDAGARGAILALANVVPERVSQLYQLHVGGNDEQARAINRRLVDLNRAVTSLYGVPGVKAALAHRGQPAGHVRRPHESLGDAARSDVEALVDEAVP